MNNYIPCSIHFRSFEDDLIDDLLWLDKQKLIVNNNLTILNYPMKLILLFFICLVISLLHAIKISMGIVNKAFCEFKHPSNYQGVIKPIRRINKELIVAEWENIQRIMVSLAIKETNQSIIVGKLSTYARKNKTRIALCE